jgi:hypothetical protein
MNTTNRAISIGLSNGNKGITIIVKEGQWTKIDISHITTDGISIIKSNDAENAVVLSTPTVQTSSVSPKADKPANSQTSQSNSRVSSKKSTTKPTMMTNEMLVKKFIDGIISGIYKVNMDDNKIFVADLYTYFQNWCKIKRYQMKITTSQFKLMVEKRHKVKAKRMWINRVLRMGFKF